VANGNISATARNRNLVVNPIAVIVKKFVTYHFTYDGIKTLSSSVRRTEIVRRWKESRIISIVFIFKSQV
jgi:hypothetical protein